MTGAALRPRWALALPPILGGVAIFFGVAHPPGAGGEIVDPDRVLSSGAGFQVPGDTIDVPSNPLEGAAVEFARGWAESSSGSLLALMAPEGIRLQLEGAGRSGLSPRQAVAAVGEFLRPYRRGGTVVSRAAVLDSSPDRGFAELLWSAMAVGTADTAPNTVFVGLIRLDGAWKVDEIRLLP